ncbi:transglutaminase domain-containing protein [Breznakiellaceae bacterium SP9]
MRKLLYFSVLVPAALCALVSLGACRRTRAVSDGRAGSRDNDREAVSPQNSSTIENLKVIYENTIKYWQYDEAAYFYHYTPQERLQSGRGICWDYALYFYHACRERKVRNVHFVVSNKLKHAWNEVWTNDTVYIIDATWADTNPYAGIDTYFMVDAALDAEHYQSDICVVDDTMEENDISSLYRGILTQDSKRQQYTAARPIVKLQH